MSLAVFEKERRRLFGLAYRMTGSVSDADDIVQDAWIRYDRAEGVRRPEAFLTTITTRLAIDRLRSAPRRRETYVGPWLPEPILTDRDPAHLVELDESITLGFLYVLDRLEPVERAVFLLREVFAVPYPEVANTVGRDEVTCRQIAHRARERVRSERPRVSLGQARRRELLDALLGAIATGDEAQLRDVLAEDVVLVSDGGPDRHAARHPIIGAHRVGRFLLNLGKRRPRDARVEVVEVNGNLAVLVSQAGEIAWLSEVALRGDRIAELHVIVNPDKLTAATVAWRRQGAGVPPGGPAT